MAFAMKNARVVHIVLGSALVGLAFAAAGTVRWPAFWVLLGVYAGALNGLIIWLKRRDPGLLKERIAGATRPGVKAWDKKIMRAYTALLAVMLLVAPLDAVRFRWSHVPLGAQGISLLGLLAAGALLMGVFRENTFLGEYVRIQGERGHAVCTTGPYRIIRHPMYAAIIVTILCVPVLLGSLYALIPAGLITGLFVLRTALEDRTLRAELPGYEEYTRQVRWRLVPGIW